MDRAQEVPPHGGASLLRAHHPLRQIQIIVDRVLEQLSPRFNKLYARTGRPSIAPEKLLRALLLQLLYSGARRGVADGAMIWTCKSCDMARAKLYIG